MQIKRKLGKLAKRMTPQIETMNVGIEMNRCCDRMNELVNYAEEKIERSKTRGKTIGQQVDEARKALDQQVIDHQTAEAEENLRDQKESFDERNKVLEKSKRIPEMTDEELAEAEAVAEAEAQDPPAHEPKPKKSTLLDLITKKQK